jgi:CP family cyanate transporter-like MFS transporter
VGPANTEPHEFAEAELTLGGGRRQTVAAVAAVAVAAFNLRIAVVAVGPVLVAIRADTGMSATLAGALGAIPFLCMGLFAQAGVPLVRRLGARLLIAGALALVTAGTLARSVMPTAALIVVATVPIGIGIALVGLALPAVIKRRFASRTGAATGTYVAALSVGASLTALTMVPLSDALGGWRGAFAVTAVPTVLAVPFWLRFAGRHRPAPAKAAAGHPRAERHRLLPSRRGSLLAVVFGLQSMCYAAVINWIAALYSHSGWSAGTAAFATAAVSILNIPAALIVPGLSDGHDRSKWLLGAALAMGIGLLGLAFAPTAASWLWIIVFSLGSGSMFPLALTLPLDLGESERTITELTAWMFGYGYILSACGPLVVGGLYELTGGFAVPMALLGALGVCSGLVALTSPLRGRPVTRAVRTAAGTPR